MTELFDYMSWNIENFSKKHAKKTIYQNLEVKYWIANLVVTMEANLLGIMEVTLGDGDKAMELLQDAINGMVKGTTWKFLVSKRNVQKTDPKARRADKYGIIWNNANVSIANLQIADSFGVSFEDRVPMFWQANKKGSKKTVNMLLWHAPQPKYTKKAATIQLMADTVHAVDNNSALTSHYFICSGDFNVDTGKQPYFTPLTSLGFKGLFDGSLTTLKSVKSYIAKNQAKFLTQPNYDLEFLSSAYDNVFMRNLNWQDELKINVPQNILEDLHTNIKFQMVTRKQAQQAITNAKIISDHMPLVTTVFA